MRLVVDRDLCCGSGNCVMRLPEVFDQSDADGLVVLLNSEPPSALRDRAREAVQLCPAGAIAVVDE